jgi:hypothetical protein
VEVQEGARYVTVAGCSMSDNRLGGLFDPSGNVQTGSNTGGNCTNPQASFGGDEIRLTTSDATVSAYGGDVNASANVAATDALVLTKPVANQTQTVTFKPYTWPDAQPVSFSFQYQWSGATLDGGAWLEFAVRNNTRSTGVADVAFQGTRLSIAADAVTFAIRDASNVVQTLYTSDAVPASNAWTAFDLSYDGASSWQFAMTDVASAARVASATIADPHTANVISGRKSTLLSTGNVNVNDFKFVYVGAKSSNTTQQLRNFRGALGAGGSTSLHVTKTGVSIGAPLAVTGAMSADHLSASRLSVGASALPSGEAAVFVAYGPFVAPPSVTAVSVSESNVTSNVLATLVGNVTLSSLSKFAGYGSLAIPSTPQTYVEIPSMRNLAWTSRPFTMECWVYPTTFSAGANYVIGQYFGNAGVHGISIGFNGAGLPYVRYYGNNDNTLRGNTAVTPNQWHHLAFCSEEKGEGNVANAFLYLDGVQQTMSGNGSQGTYFTMDNPRPFNYPFTIGGVPGPTASSPPVSIQAARVLLGNMAYTSSFTPGLLAKGPSTANTALLLTVPNLVSGMTVSGAGAVSVTGDVAVTGNVSASRLSTTGNVTVSNDASVSGTLTTGSFVATGNAKIAVASTAPSLANGQMTFFLVNDTTLAVQVRGSDGVLRSGNVNLS